MFDFSQVNPAVAFVSAVNAATDSDNKYRSNKRAAVIEEAADNASFFAATSRQVRSFFETLKTQHAKTA